MTHRNMAVVTLFAALVILAGCSSDNKGGMNPVGTPQITVSEQTPDPANQVVVAEVTASESGWVVIHEADGATYGAPIGHAAVPSGTSTSVVVTLSRDVVDDEVLYAMLHADVGQIGTFEFPGADVPVTVTKAGMEEMVLESFTVHVVGPVTPSITAANQTLNNLSTQVAVAAVTSDGPGWITIHEEGGTLLGHTAVGAGSTSDVTVTLDRPAQDGEMLNAMLHVDAGVVGVFEFPGVDVPALNAQQQPVEQAFSVVVAAGTPALRLRVSNVGTSAFRFTAVEPEGFAGVIGPQGNNQTLTLQRDWRYEVVNSASTGHPFEFITRGGSPAADVVLLSQVAAGSLEGDASIGWSQSGNAVRFTLSPSLAIVLNGYRCSIHSSVMRGSVVIP